MIIQRVSADALEGSLIAPDWSAEKGALLQLIDKRFLERNTRQGARYNS